MPHLKCAEGRRVVVLANHKVFHRNGDGSQCYQKISYDGKPVVVSGDDGILVRAK